MRFLSTVWVALALLLSLATEAGAACTSSNVTANFGTARVMGNAAVGSEFGDATVRITYTCDSSTLTNQNARPDPVTNNVVFQLSPTATETNAQYVYPTNVSGVGIRWREASTKLALLRAGDTANAEATNSFCWRDTTPNDSCGSLPATQCPLTESGGTCVITVAARLVKTGPITGGELGVHNYVNISYYAPGVTNTRYLNSVSISGTVLTAASCAMQDMTVPLGTVTLQRLSNTSSQPVPFNVQLTGCESSLGIDLTFTTLNQSGEQCEGLMRNAASGTATGVTIRVARDADVPLCWGDRIQYTTRADGSLTVPMTARMQSMAGATPTAGTVRGSVVVNATYR